MQYGENAVCQDMDQAWDWNSVLWAPVSCCTLNFRTVLASEFLSSPLTPPAVRVCVCVLYARGQPQKPFPTELAPYVFPL